MYIDFYKSQDINVFFFDSFTNDEYSSIVRITDTQKLAVIREFHSIEKVSVKMKTINDFK